MQERSLHAGDDVQQSAAGSLKDFFGVRSTNAESSWAWDNYGAVISDLATYFGCHSICEIGGGRFPLLSGDQTARLGVRYTINDISASELARVPDWAETACFDIAGPVTPKDRRFDLLFSKMVLEHVIDSKQAYRNIWELLNPDGVFLNFYPTLYAFPFLVNHLLPDMLTRRAMEWVWPHRSDDDVPKFPAYYSWCRSTDTIAQMIKDVGFREVLILPFYGHGYTDRIPVVKTIERGLARWARQHDVRLLSSYAFAVGRK
jgi:SAM-dependent methyltransferase